MKMLILGLTLATLAAACAAIPETPKTKEIVLGGGCFWCVEAIYEDLKGVQAVESGYAGGFVKNPTYRQVCAGTTGHAEVVKITYDPGIISTRDILRIFFTTHDPTTLNRQGPDAGTQYRSVILFKDDEEKTLAQEVIKEVVDEQLYRNPIVTTLEPLKAYYPAEDYHQDYFEKFEKASESERAQMNAGYCAAIIEPKVQKFRQKYAAKLKKGG
jgi:peptide-methionine (S)-S-oxide reductase